MGANFTKLTVRDFEGLLREYGLSVRRAKTAISLLNKLGGMGVCRATDKSHLHYIDLSELISKFAPHQPYQDAMTHAVLVGIFEGNRSRH